MTSPSLHTPRYLYLGEPFRGECFDHSELDRRSRELCAALTPRYPGVRFNRVRVIANDDLDLKQGRDLIDVCFNVSGSRTDLERHRFAHPSWLQDIRTTKLSGLQTSGFGWAYSILRTRTGYRVTDAMYEDGLDRLLPVCTPALLGKFLGKEARP
jgi:hypothetical protein